jgi:hypothetical protein
MKNLFFGLAVVLGLVSASSVFAAEKTLIQISNNTQQPIDYRVERTCVPGEDGYNKTIYPMSATVITGEAKLDGSCATEAKVLTINLTGGATRGKIETTAKGTQKFSEPTVSVESGNYPRLERMGPDQINVIFGY